MGAGADSFTSGPAPLVSRAAMAGCVAGAVVGGVVGTVDWPVVGTFVGTLYGSVLGGLAGVTDGLVLAVVASRARSWWAVRVVSGLVWLLAAGAAAATDGPFTVLRHAAGQAIVAAVCVLAGAVAGPVIVFGRDPAVPAGRLVGVPLARVVRRVLVWGSAGGASAGAVVGLVIGIRTYLPTSPFAAVEGAVLGSVTGIVLAAVLGGLAVLPRLWVHR